MAKLIVLYKKPADPAAFDQHYQSVHVPTAKKIPGLRSYEVSTGEVKAGRGESPYHLVAMLGFDSMDELAQGMATPEGAATAKDLKNFAQAGVEMLMFDSKEI